VSVDEIIVLGKSLLSLIKYMQVAKARHERIKKKGEEKVQTAF